MKPVLSALFVQGIRPVLGIEVALGPVLDCCKSNIVLACAGSNRYQICTGYVALC